MDNSNHSGRAKVINTGNKYWFLRKTGRLYSLVLGYFLLILFGGIMKIWGGWWDGGWFSLCVAVNASVNLSVLVRVIKPLMIICDKFREGGADRGLLEEQELLFLQTVSKWTTFTSFRLWGLTGFLFLMSVGGIVLYLVTGHREWAWIGLTICGTLGTLYGFVVTSRNEKLLEASDFEP